MGAEQFFCDQELVESLNANTKKTKLVIKTLNHEESVNSAVVTDDLQITGLDERDFIDLPSVHIQDNIPVSTDDAPTQEDINIWETPKGHQRQTSTTQGKEHNIKSHSHAGNERSCNYHAS